MGLSVSSVPLLFAPTDFYTFNLLLSGCTCHQNLFLFIFSRSSLLGYEPGFAYSNRSVSFQQQHFLQDGHQDHLPFLPPYFRYTIGIPNYRDENSSKCVSPPQRPLPYSSPYRSISFIGPSVTVLETSGWPTAFTVSTGICLEQLSLLESRSSSALHISFSI
jgi:hypothetical protein